MPLAPCTPLCFLQMVGLDLHKQWKNPQTSRPLAEPNNMQNVEKRHKRQRVWTRHHFLKLRQVSGRHLEVHRQCLALTASMGSPSNYWVYKTEPNRVRLARNMAVTVTEWAWMCGLLLLDFMWQIFCINQLMGSHWSIDPLYVHGFPGYIHLFWLSQIKGVVRGQQATGNINWAVPGSIRSWQKKVHSCPLSTSQFTNLYRFPGDVGCSYDPSNPSKAVQAHASHHQSHSPSVVASRS